MTNEVPKKTNGHEPGRKNDEKSRFFSYAMDNLRRAYDELCTICVSIEDSSHLQEVSALLHKITREFDAYKTTLKFKNVVPLPSVTDSATSLKCNVPNDSKSGTIVNESQEKSVGTDEACGLSKSQGINVAAPDFIPSINEESNSLYTDQGVQTSWQFKSNKDNEILNNSEHDYIDSPVDFDRNNQEFSTYLDSPHEFENNYYNVPPGLVSPSFFSLHPPPYQSYPRYYQHLSPHYHLPMSLFSHEMGNPNVMHIPQVNAYQNPSHYRLRPSYTGQDKALKNRHNSNYKQSKSIHFRKQYNLNRNIGVETDNRKEKDKTFQKEKYFTSEEEESATIDKDILNCEKSVKNIFPENVELEALRSDTSNNLVDSIAGHEKSTKSPTKENHDDGDSAVPIREVLVDEQEREDNNSTNVLSSSMVVSKKSKKDDKAEKHSFLGLAEKEHFIHFPELSSGLQKKGKIKVNTSKEESFEAPEIQLANGQGIDSKKSSSLFKNVENRVSFSDITKSSYHPVEKPSSDNSSVQITPAVKYPNKNVLCAAVSSKQVTSKRREIEVWTEESCTFVSPTDNSDEDAGGWEVVKTRSKWREPLDLRPPPRQHWNKLKKSHNKPVEIAMSLSSVQCVAGSMVSQVENNFSSSVTLALSHNNYQNLYSEDRLEKSFEMKNLTSRKKFLTDNLNDHFSSGATTSIETLYNQVISQSETTSPELGLNDETVSIDPNEMYSAYLQYLSNIEEEEVSSGSSTCELVLHPEIINGVKKETEVCQNPASLEQMTYFVNNDPIRALDFKKKLDSRIRHQDDVKQKNEEKQQLAHEKRLQFLQDKTAKIRGFVQKVEEVKAAQHQLALQRKNRLDLKLKKAEEKRNMHLNIIKRKAHDEEEKLKEIAFINELEAQNRRHDSLALRQEHEERLQYLVEERQRKLEEKAAKEAAVEERRKALEAVRQEKLELLKERRRKKEETLDRKQQEKEQERLVIAREKAREREVRLLARHTAQQATLEELQKKIQQKQEESAKRHIESIELIRQKAIEIGIHRNISDNSVPKYLYKPEFKGNNVQYKYKLYLKKRLKKIKSRMVLRGSNFIEVTHNNKKELTIKESLLEKVFNKLQKYEPHKIYLWETEDCESVDRFLDEILFFLQEEPSLKTALKDMKAFLFFDSVINTFNYANHEKVSLPSLRCILKIITICDLSCLESLEICLYFLLSNVLTTLLDSLRFSLQALEKPSKSWDLIVEILLRFHALVIDGLSDVPEAMLLTIPDFSTRMKDLISYILCCGLVYRLIDLFQPSIIEEKFIYGSLVVPSILFFERLLSTWFISDDLVDILKSTDLLGTVPLLYEGLMKHIINGGPLPEYCMPAISLFLKLADVDLKLFKDILGAENIALQWRGIASGLMTYCVSRRDSKDLLNSVIKLVGYFAIHNKNNQTLLQSGKQPTVLQQLVKLPFKYFCDPEYMEILFPTLISCSYNNITNRAIVENEIDYSFLEEFMNSEIGRKNKIIQLLLCENSEDTYLPLDAVVAVESHSNTPVATNSSVL